MVITKTGNTSLYSHFQTNLWRGGPKKIIPPQTCIAPRKGQDTKEYPINKSNAASTDFAIIFARR